MIKNFIIRGIFSSCLLCLVAIPSFGLAKDMTGRLGVGMVNNYYNGIPSLSIKLQKTPLFALGAMLGMRFSTSDSGGYAGGLKFYRNIFDEPNLNFYAAGAVSLINVHSRAQSETGVQVDATLGSEFHFVGLDSLGFSVEFGVSLTRMYDEFYFDTLANHMIRAGIHFYL